MSKRPALVPVDHPLSYAQREKFAPHQPQTLEEKVHHLLEVQHINDLLNEFTYALDGCLADPATLETYVALLTDDVQLHFPFGSYKGTKGIPQMVLNAESRFSRMMVRPLLFFTPKIPESMQSFAAEGHLHCSLHTEASD